MTFPRRRTQSINSTTLDVNDWSTVDIAGVCPNLNWMAFPVLGQLCFGDQITAEEVTSIPIVTLYLKENLQAILDSLGPFDTPVFNGYGDTLWDWYNHPDPRLVHRVAES